MFCAQPTNISWIFTDDTKISVSVHMNDNNSTNFPSQSTSDELRALLDHNIFTVTYT